MLGRRPVSYRGKFFSFDEVWVEPRPYRPDGPGLWFGGQHLHGPFLRRLVRWGKGFNPLGRPSPEDLAALQQGLLTAGRPIGDIEMIGGTSGHFTDSIGPASIDEALQALPAQLAAGFDTICFKPSMYVEQVSDVPAFCRGLVRKVEAIAS